MDDLGDDDDAIDANIDNGIDKSTPCSIVVEFVVVHH